MHTSVPPRPVMQRSVYVPLLTAALLAVAGPSAAQNASGGLSLDLNIPTSKLVVRDGAKVVKTYPVSVGLLGHDTPTGEYEVSRAEWNPWWRPPEREWAKDDKVTPPGPNNPMGRVKLFFAPYYYFHGTPDVKNIGAPASHGCVRLLNKDAIELGKLLHRRADATVPASAVDRILANSSNTRWVNFRDPVPVRIRYDLVVVENGDIRVYPDVYKRKALHPEAVYQALLAAGYDVSSLRLEDLRTVVDRAKAHRKGIFSIPVSEAFGGALALRAAS